MSIPIILKSGVFTLVITGLLTTALLFTNNMNYFSHGLLVIIIFFLVLDVFEREAKRLGKKI